MWILRNFLEHIFYRTPSVECFWRMNWKVPCSNPTWRRSYSTIWLIMYSSHPIRLQWLFHIKLYLKMFIRANILIVNKITRSFISMEKLIPQDLKTLWTDISIPFTWDLMKEIEILVHNVFKSCVINFSIEMKLLVILFKLNYIWLHLRITFFILKGERSSIWASINTVLFNESPLYKNARLRNVGS